MGIVIKCADPNEHVMILKPWPNTAFSSANISVHVAGNQLPEKVVIRSVPFDATMDKVKEELAAQEIHVNKLDRIKSPKMGLSTPLVKINIPNIKEADRILSSDVTLFHSHHQVEEVKNSAPQHHSMLQMPMLRTHLDGLQIFV